jgi:hypothetical protein
MSQEQDEQKRRFEHYLNTCERAEEDSDDNDSSDNDESSYENEDTSEEENPLPQWNIPNWQGNAAEVSICPCIKQVVEDGSVRGCAECDEYWDMPSLVTQYVEYECCHVLAN